MTHHRDNVLQRATTSPLMRVRPANWRERRALRRMSAYGAAEPVPGLPDVWRICT